MIIANFSQLCSRLAVFRGEFWSVKFIETRDLFQVLFRHVKGVDLRETQKWKQKSKYEI